MRSSIRSARPLPPARLVLALLLAPLAACSGGDSDDNAFEVRTIDGSTDPNLTPLVSSSWLVYARSEALEAGGTDLNGDGDTTDLVASAARLGTTTDIVLGVASEVYAGLANEILLVVEESEDGRDWDGDGNADDRVLLHWSNDAGGPTFVDLLGSNASDEAEVVHVGTRAYYRSVDSPSSGDDTNLRFVSQSDPLTPVAVENTAGGGPLELELLGEREGLLFLSADESEAGADLNGDADATDATVLALLDGTDSTARVVLVGLALEDDSAPFDAHFEGANDWVVGFLVDETAQGATNLNPPTVDGQTVVPDSCLATPDSDTLDQVLHWLRFDDFASGTDDAHNTGVAGTDRVVAVNDAVATLSAEVDATCDYNEDGDAADTMVRWIEATVGTFPPRDPTQLHAVQTGVPGGSMGLSALGSRLVSVVSEAQDSDNLDGKGANHDLVAWINPSGGGSEVWTFAHQNSNPNFGTGLSGEPYAGASWLAPDEDEGRLGVAFQETVPNRDLNTFTLNCDVDPKDGDTLDSLPVWLDFEAGPTLDFDGLGFACVPADAGVVVSRGWVFFKLDEADDATDYNNDGDMVDVITFRNPVAACDPHVLATGHPQPGAAVFTDDARGCAFFSSEFAAGMDLNGDGDTNDTVLRHFVF